MIGDEKTHQVSRLKLPEIDKKDSLDTLVDRREDA